MSLEDAFAEQIAKAPELEDGSRLVYDGQGDQPRLVVHMTRGSATAGEGDSSVTVCLPATQDSPARPALAAMRAVRQYHYSA